MRGTVNWFSMEKGYGFIKSEDGKEVFVHYSNVNKKGYRVLYQDEIVDFEIGTNSDGREQAIDVTPILTIKMIESALKKDNLFLQSMKDAYGVKKYLVVDENNVLQTGENGMTVDELIDYLNNK
ncbi:cold shock domain-containing protein [Anaerotignum sp.]